MLQFWDWFFQNLFEKHFFKSILTVFLATLNFCPKLWLSIYRDFTKNCKCLDQLKFTSNYCCNLTQATFDFRASFTVTFFLVKYTTFIKLFLISQKMLPLCYHFSLANFLTLFHVGIWLFTNSTNYNYTYKAPMQRKKLLTYNSQIKNWIQFTSMHFDLFKQQDVLTWYFLCIVNKTSKECESLFLF